MPPVAPATAKAATPRCAPASVQGELSWLRSSRSPSIVVLCSASIDRRVMSLFQVRRSSIMRIPIPGWQHLTAVGSAPSSVEGYLNEQLPSDFRAAQFRCAYLPPLNRQPSA